MALLLLGALFVVEEFADLGLEALCGRIGFFLVRLVTLGRHRRRSDEATAQLVGAIFLGGAFAPSYCGGYCGRSFLYSGPGRGGWCGVGGADPLRGAVGAVENRAMLEVEGSRSVKPSVGSGLARSRMP